MMMIYFNFVFYKKDTGEKMEKDFWAFDKEEAWSVADDWAHKNGYTDYKMEED